MHNRVGPERRLAGDRVPGPGRAGAAGRRHPGARVLSPVRAAAQRADRQGASSAASDPDPDCERGAMTLLAAAHIKGPHIDWLALSPIIVLGAGALLVLLVGLIGAAHARERVVPVLTLARPRGVDRARDLAVQAPGLDRLRRPADRRPGAGARPAVLRGGDRHRAAVLAARARRGRRARASTTACCCSA